MPDVVEKIEPLSSEEKVLLEAEEWNFGQVADAWLNGMQSLLNIYNLNLYREYGSFPDYMKKRWKSIHSSYAWRLLDFARVSVELKDASDIDLSTFNEGQARALKAFPERLWSIIYRLARSQSPTGKPTAEQITRIGKELELRAKYMTDEALAVAEILARGRQPPLHPFWRGLNDLQKALKRFKHTELEWVVSALEKMLADLEAEGEKLRQN